VPRQGIADSDRGNAPEATDLHSFPTRRSSDLFAWAGQTLSPSVGGARRSRWRAGQTRAVDSNGLPLLRHRTTVGQNPALRRRRNPGFCQESCLLCFVHGGLPTVEQVLTIASLTCRHLCRLLGAKRLIGVACRRRLNLGQNRGPHSRHG